MISIETVKKYTIDKHKHRFYVESVKIKNELSIHANGETGSHLVDLARPNEEPIYKDYRKGVEEPITKTYFEKIVNVFGKIRLAPDWQIVWPESKSIVNNPETFFEREFDVFGSLQKWFFSVGIDLMLDDPNAVVSIYPSIISISDNEYIKPKIHVFGSDEVVGVEQGLFVFNIKEIPESDYDLIPKSEKTDIFIFLDKDEIQKWILTDKEYVMYFQQKLTNDVVPAFKIGGRVRKFEQGYTLYESFIQSVVPHWNEAVRRYSDHQVNMVLHLHPDRWEIVDAECKVCRGLGTQEVPTGKGQSTKVKCNNCNSTGKVSVRTPFGTKMIRAVVKEGASDAFTTPTPPMGYAERPIESIDFLNKEWKSCIQQGLSALNMEFLMYEPAVNSGTAKALDRSELNAFLYTVASYIVNDIFFPIYRIMATQRYGLLFDKKTIDEHLPKINIPKKFDVLNSAAILGIMKESKESGSNGAIVDEIGLEYAEKEFGKESLAYLKLQNKMQLDPMPSLTADEKMAVYMNKGCNQEQYIISSQIDNFFNRAISENIKYPELKLSEKLAINQGYAKEVIDSTKTEPIDIYAGLGGNN